MKEDYDPKSANLSPCGFDNIPILTFRSLLDRLAISFMTPLSLVGCLNPIQIFEV